MRTVEELAAVCKMLVGHWYVRSSTLRILTAPSERFSGFRR